MGMPRFSGNVKAGDEVVILNPRWERQRYTVATVDRLTPTGRIVIGREHFYPDGSLIGGGYSGRKLIDATPEVRASIRRREILDRIGRTKFEEIPSEALEAIAAILDAKACYEEESCEP